MPTISSAHEFTTNDAAFPKLRAGRNRVEAAELLDPDVETVTPRGTLRGIRACRQVLQKASGDEQFELEQPEPEFEEVDGDVIAHTHEIARWREPARSRMSATLLCA